MAVMKRLLYQGRTIHIDETRLQVLNEPNRENTQLSYMWVYGGGPPRRLPFGAESVLYFRTLDDFRRLRTLADGKSEFIVIGSKIACA